MVTRNPQFIYRAVCMSSFVGNHVFRYDTAGISFEFVPKDKKLVFKQGSDSKEMVKE
jgi:hypothetical protein